VAGVIVLDASVLIAYLDPNDAHHSAAVEVLAAATPPLLVHSVTAAEVLVAAVRQGVADAVWADLSAIGVEIDHTPTDPMLLARLRVETGCKMPDCCVLSSARSRAVGVATFDERIRRFAGPSA
jgi:predicted nucleic acid-binding protein